MRRVARLPGEKQRHRHAQTRGQQHELGDPPRPAPDPRQPIGREGKDRRRDDDRTGHPRQHALLPRRPEVVHEAAGDVNADDHGLDDQRHQERPAEDERAHAAQAVEPRRIAQNGPQQRGGHRGLHELAGELDEHHRCRHVRAEARPSGARGSAAAPRRTATSGGPGPSAARPAGSLAAARSRWARPAPAAFPSRSRRPRSTRRTRAASRSARGASDGLERAPPRRPQAHPLLAERGVRASQNTPWPGPRRPRPQRTSRGKRSTHEARAVAADRISRRWLKLIGFVMWTSKPAAAARVRSSGCPYPVSATRKMSEPPAARMRRATS